MPARRRVRPPAGAVRRRKNPDFSAETFAALLRDHGDARLADLVERYPDVVAPYLTRLEKRARDRGYTGTMSDADAWAMLAWHAPRALAGESPRLIAAVVSEFARA